MKDQAMLDEVMRYLDDDTYSYALMIDGKWGAGKTHFVIDTLPKYLNTNNEKGKESNLRYFSVCGCTTLNEFKENMAYELIRQKTKEIPEDVDKEIEKQKEERERKKAEFAAYEGEDKKSFIDISKEFLDEKTDVVKEHIYNNVIKDSRVFSLGFDIGSRVVSGLLKSKIPVMKTVELGDYLSDVSSMAKHIFIFDDIERCSFPLYDLLCFINELVEKVRAKVILINNENVLKKSEAQYKSYMQIKEKIVGRELYYEPECKVIFERLAKANFEEGTLLNSLVVDNIDRFIETMEKRKHYSMRTFQFFLSKLKSIAAVVEKIEKERGFNISDAQYSLLVRATLAICFDFKNEIFNYDEEPVSPPPVHKHNLKSIEAYVRTGIMDEDAFANELMAL